MPKYSALVVMGLVLALLSCGDDGPSLNPPASQSYPVEKDPVYSADSNAVFFISVDTVHAERTAVLYAEADMPIRRRLAIGSDVTLADATSLSVSPSARSLQYLATAARHMCTLSTQPACSTVASYGESSVSFITDSLLLFGRNDSLFVANLAESNPSFVARGWEPRLERNGEIIFVSQLAGSGYGVLRYRVSGAIDTVYDFSGQDRPRWPDLDTTGGWLAYTVDSSEVYLVHVVDLVQRIDRRVALTTYSRTCIVAQTLILFTGANGLLYQIGYRGGTAIPWMYVKE